MKVQVLNIRIELTQAEYTAMNQQAPFLVTETFNAQKLIKAFQVNYAQHFAILELPHYTFTILVKRLATTINSLDYTHKFGIGAWSEFSDKLNQAKV